MTARGWSDLRGAAARTLVVIACLVSGTALDALRAEVGMPGRPEKVFLVTQVPEAVVPGRIKVRPEPQAWHRLFNAGSARVVDFPLPGGPRVELEVAAYDLLTPDARFVVSDAGGLRQVAGPALRFFRGQVPGDHDSLVSLTLFDGRFAGFVRTGGKEYTLGPREFAAERAGADDIEIVDDTTVSGPGMTCDGDEVAPARRGAPADATAPLLEGLSAPSLQAIDATTLLLGRIAVEGTVEWVTRLGGVAAAQTYTLNLMAQVSAVYENEVRVQLQVPYVLMNAAEPDGYTGDSNSTSTILGEMRTKWNGTPALQQVFRSAVHVFSTYPSGGAGRAYIDVLCSDVPANSNAYDYGVSLLGGAGASWERLLVAHEIGHNFSSPHSHCYVPELDQCYNTETGCYSGTVVQTTGTIMSYCNSRVTTFHQRTRDERIRPGAEAAYPACMDIAGMPGVVSHVDVTAATMCPAADLVADDGAYNGSYGYSGTAQAAWVKRFTPPCYPFKLTSVDVRFSHSSVSPGRAIRLLVYTDPSGGGNPQAATVVHSEDTTVQVVSSSQWNQYTLSSPVLVASGDYYIGFFDLVADSGSTYIMDYDSSHGGDSFWQADSTDPSGFVPFTSTTGTWMIRGHGGGLGPGSLVLTWDPPCNDATVPNQDFAVYQGAIGNWSSLASVTCTTGRARSWLIDSPPPGQFWEVVPENSVNEGSYGQSSMGERPPALSPCRPQAVGACQ
jgi:hypothetical protein